MHSHECIQKRSFWFPVVVQTALLFLVAPWVYWVALDLILADGHIHFGSVLALLLGVSMTYPSFGISLLVGCAIAAIIMGWLSRFPSFWTQLTFGALAGTTIGLLLGGYIAIKISRDAGTIFAEGSEYRELLVAGPIAGAILGVALPGLWRIARWWASGVSRTLAEPGAAPEPPPAAAVRKLPETMSTKPESEAPADGGGR